MSKVCSKNKENILKKLEEKRDELNKQIDMIKKLEIKPVTEDEWYKLCETPVRYNDVLLDIAEVTFPEGEDFEMCANEVAFKMNGFDISVSTSAIRGITIDMRWYKPFILEDFEPLNRYEKMRRYFELLDSGRASWYELAQSRCRVNFNKFQLFRWWFLKGKWHKVNREKWEKVFDEEDRENKKMQIKHEIRRKGLLSKIKEFHKTVDILKEWSEVRGYVPVDGVYSTRNIENYLR